MQLKSLLTSGLLLALTSMPLSVLGGSGRVSYYGPQPSKSDPPSCGSKDSIYFAKYYIALNKEQLDSDKSNLCGKCIKIVYNNKYLVGRLVDRCSGCGYGGLDISPEMFTFFEEKKKGIFYTNWEYVSCDYYGQKGSCSGSSCGMSSSGSGSSSSKKTTTKTSSTTTTVKSTTTSAPSSSVAPVSSSVAPNATTTSVNPNASTTIASTSTNININANNGNSTVVPSSADANAANKTTQDPITNKGNEPVVVNNVDKEEDGEKNTSSLVIPVTGVLMVSGAAGVGLLYAKRKRNDIGSLKQAFPEAFKSIKRSLTHGASIRRNITRNYTKKSSNLDNTNTVDSVNNTRGASTSQNQYSEMDISETRITVN